MLLCNEIDLQVNRYYWHRFPFSKTGYDTNTTAPAARFFQAHSPFVGALEDDILFG